MIHFDLESSLELWTSRHMLSKSHIGSLLIKVQYLVVLGISILVVSNFGKSCKTRPKYSRQCIFSSFMTLYEQIARKLRLTKILENSDLSLYLWLDQSKVSVWSNYWMELHQIFSEWHKFDIKLFHSSFVRYFTLSWPNRTAALENFHAWRRPPFYSDLDPKWGRSVGSHAMYTLQQ